MARVKVEVDYSVTTNDEGREVDCVNVTCTRCGAVEEVYGQSDASIRRGCVMLRDNCDEKHFYVADE